MHKLVCLMAVAAALVACSNEANAQYHNQFNAPNSAPLFHRLTVRQPLPAFQAAPWYLYWPYNAHFMTPAPLGLNTPYYSPGSYGGSYSGQGNPYFSQLQQGNPQPGPIPQSGPAPQVMPYKR